MRRYWINFKGKQEGPLSLDELAKMGIDKSAIEKIDFDILALGEDHQGARVERNA